MTFPIGGPTLSMSQGQSPTAFADAQAVLQWARQIAAAFNQSLALSNTTGGRPTAAQLEVLPLSGVGYSVFDTTLGKPIWWRGAAWVDATGTAV